VHFPRLCPKSSSGPKVPERISAPDQSLCAPQSESVDILLKDINALCQQLNAVSDDSTPDLQALRSIKYSLRAAIVLANGSRALPERDVFNPNQKTWPKTAERMGVRKTSKWKQSPVPIPGNTELSPPDIWA
jgi:hypothetical protein